MSDDPFAALSLNTEKPARLFLLDIVSREPIVDDAGNAAYIDVYSGDSAIAKECSASASRKMIARGLRAHLTPEEREAQALDLLSSLTAGWYLVHDGKHMDVPFSKSAARALYAAGDRTWIREQVDEFAANRANFSKASSTN